jgi:hypothetical protein
MTRIVFMYSTPSSTRYVLVRGHVGRWFKDRRIPALRSPMDGGFWLRKERASQVLAELDFCGYAVRWVDGEAPPYVPPEMVDLELGSVA